MQLNAEVAEEGGMNGAVPLINLLEEQVKTATDMLLLTDFTGCLALCQRVVAAAIPDEHSRDVTDRFKAVKESATVLAIQALAEQESWREVIPFVEKVFGHIGACPGSVMQVCLLLHAHVREYHLCHSLFNIWLDTNDHRSLPESVPVVRIYVNNVLVPLRAFNLIRQVVESCSALSLSERQALLSPNTSQTSSCGDHSRPNLLPDVSQNVKDSIMKSPNTQAPKGKNSDKGLRAITTYLNFMRRLWRGTTRKGWCQQICRLSKMLLFVSFALLALMHLQTDVGANFSYTMEILKTTIQRLAFLWRSSK